MEAANGPVSMAGPQSSYVLDLPFWQHIQYYSVGKIAVVEVIFWIRMHCREWL